MFILSILYGLPCVEQTLYKPLAVVLTGALEGRKDLSTGEILRVTYNQSKKQCLSRDKRCRSNQLAGRQQLGFTQINKIPYWDSRAFGILLHADNVWQLQ